MITRACIKCGETKTKRLEVWYKGPTCRSCYRKARSALGLDTRKEYLKRYYEKNKENIKNRVKKYSIENSEKVNLKKREYYYKNQKSMKEKFNEYRKNHKEQKNEYERNKMRTDINYKLRNSLRNRIKDIVLRKTKCGSFVKDLGCSVEFLKQHLESQFKKGMTWENWTINGWHIDHIIPLKEVDLTNREQFLKVCHYTNLRPLWWNENIGRNRLDLTVNRN